MAEGQQVNDTRDGSRRVLLGEIGLAMATALLAIVSLISREWIEIVFGVDPDHGSGVIEWLIVVGLAAATLTFGLLARAGWRRPRVSPVPAAPNSDVSYHPTVAVFQMTEESAHGRHYRR